MTDGALVSINSVMDLRTLSKAELKGDKEGEYFLGVDVARSESTANNQCSVAVVKVKRSEDGRIVMLQLVNLINIPSILNFKVQAQEVMKIRNRYNAKAVCVDGNGLGAGLIDNLVLEQIDPATGESLGCWKTINTDQESELDNAEEILFNLKSQGINSEIIINFIDTIEGKKLQLLEKRMNISYDENSTEHVRKEVVPFIETDSLLDEIANLRMKQLPSGRLTVEQQVSKIDKDKYSALAYVLWYIQNFENDHGDRNPDVSVTDYLLIN